MKRYIVTEEHVKKIFNAGAHWATVAHNPDAVIEDCLRVEVPDWATHFADLRYSSDPTENIQVWNYEEIKRGEQ